VSPRREQLHRSEPERSDLEKMVSIESRAVVEVRRHSKRALRSHETIHSS